MPRNTSAKTDESYNLCRDTIPINHPDFKPYSNQARHFAGPSWLRALKRIDPLHALVLILIIGIGVTLYV